MSRNPAGAGAEVDATDADKRAALAYATRTGDLETVKLLVESGAFIGLIDRFYKTPMLYAAEGRHREILFYLGGTLKAQNKAAW